MLVIDKASEYLKEQGIRMKPDSTVIDILTVHGFHRVAMLTDDEEEKEDALDTVRMLAFLPEETA